MRLETKADYFHMKALEELEQTDLLMRELLDLQAELAAHEDSLVDLANNVAQGEDIVRSRKILPGRSLNLTCCSHR